MYWLKFIGLIVVIIIGVQFYRGFVQHSRNDERPYAKLGRVSEGFVRSLFQAMGQIAKVDGRVSENEIRAARRVMHRLSLSPALVRKAIAWFDAGKQAGFPLQQMMREAARLHVRSNTERTSFVRLLLDVVLAKDRLPKEERAMIWTVCSELGIGRVELAQLEAMIRAQKGFKRSPAGDADARRLKQAYVALGVTEAASNDDVKKAYRRLMNKNHPDKISASNPSSEEVSAAEKRTREVRTAYEMLKARRSIR